MNKNRKKKIMKWLFFFTAVIVTGVSVLGMGTTSKAINKTSEAWGKSAISLDEGTEYHAWLVFQVKESWVCRYFPYDDSLGVENTELWNRVWTTCNRDDAEAVDGDLEDAVIKGNGHYTIKVSNLNGVLTAETAGSEPVFGIVAIATDIPKDDAVQFDNITVTIDGIESGTKANADLYYDRDFTEEPGVFCIDLINTWHDECQDMPLLLPNDSMEISFDVTGFHYDNPDAVEETPEPVKKEVSSEAKAAGDNDSDTQMAVGTFVTIAAICMLLLIFIIVIVFVLKRRGRKKSE